MEHNLGRHLSSVAFNETLSDLLGHPRVSEAHFRDSWLRRLHERCELTENGWYDPPPDGVAVLFARDDAVDRICFESLRLEQYWPSEVAMDWNRGLMYAYCSPVEMSTGLAGDFGITLYFGRDRALRRHFRAAFNATHQVLGAIEPTTSSRSLFDTSQRIFGETGLENTIASVTDSVPLDLGHSLPCYHRQAVASRRVSPEVREVMRRQRRFISGGADWPLATVNQVTIEPQLVSSRQRALPQISFHYVATFVDGRVDILNECDEVYRQFELID